MQHTHAKAGCTSVNVYCLLQLEHSASQPAPTGPWLSAGSRSLLAFCSTQCAMNLTKCAFHHCPAAGSTKLAVQQASQLAAHDCQRLSNVPRAQLTLVDHCCCYVVYSVQAHVDGEQVTHDDLISKNDERLHNVEGIPCEGRGRGGPAAAAAQDRERNTCLVKEAVPGAVPCWLLAHKHDLNMQSVHDGSRQLQLSYC